MSKGKTKTKAKTGRTGPDRAPDQTKYTKDDRQEPSPGQGQWPAGYRSSGLFRPAQQNSTKNTGTGKGSSHQNKGKGKHHGMEVIICQICMCALGWNAGCAPDHFHLASQLRALRRLGHCGAQVKQHQGNATTL